MCGGTELIVTRAYRIRGEAKEEGGSPFTGNAEERRDSDAFLCLDKWQKFVIRV